jgi:hypothetical protein
MINFSHFNDLTAIHFHFLEEFLEVPCDVKVYIQVFGGYWYWLTSYAQHSAEIRNGGYDLLMAVLTRHVSYIDI